MRKMSMKNKEKANNIHDEFNHLINTYDNKQLSDLIDLIMFHVWDDKLKSNDNQTNFNGTVY